VSDKYSLEITPAGWTFYIWGFIYAYQVCWLIYAISTLFRKNKSGEYLYCDPAYMSPFIYIVYMVNLALNITWTFVFDREMLVAALIVLILIVLTLYACVIISARDLHKYGPQMIELGMCREIWLVRLVVHQAWGIYAAWTIIATLLNLGYVMSYVGNIPQYISSGVCLLILALKAIAYFLLDNFVFDTYLRYMITPYIILHVALIGSLSKNWNPLNSNSPLSSTSAPLALALLLFVFCLTCIKVWLMIWRHTKKPIPSKSQVNVTESGGLNNPAMSFEVTIN
jgi:hypothetical protein